MMKPSRILVKKAYQVASATQTTFRSSKTLYHLADMGMGAVIGSQYTISRDQRDTLRSWLSQQGIDWKKPFPDKADGNRMGMSKTAINEKLAGQKEKSPWVWVTPLGGGVSINEQPLPLIHESFVSLRRTRDYQFQARALVLVENHDAFTQHEDGDCQPSCPSIKVHAAHLLSSISLARPGFRETSITGLQSRVAPVQRLGFFALAALKTASR